MTKIIQQVSFHDGSLLYITGWDEDNQILRYRKTNLGYKEISEVVNIQDDKVLLSDSWFALPYLLKFIKENKQL